MKTSREAEIIVEKATEYAVKLGHEFITSEHILLALLEDKNFNYVLNQYGIDVTNFTNEVKEYVLGIAVVKGKITQPKKTAAVDRIFNRAFTSTMFSGRERVTIWDIFISLSHENNTHSSYFILKYGVEREDFVNFIRQYFTNEMMNEQQKSYYENILEEYCTNLNTLVEEGKIDTVVGRKKEINEILQTFARRNKSNVLMVGDPGVGKTAIAEGLAKRIVEQDVPSYLKDYTVYNLEVGVILAGTQYRGQFEERIQEILEALIHKEKTILFIDEAHTMKGAGNGSNGGTDMANMLKPMLSKGKIKVIANTTWEEYTESFEKDRALMRRFYKLSIDEPDADTTEQILIGLSPRLEQFHNVLIETDAITSAVELANRYITDRKNPDKSIDIIDAACARERVKDQGNVTVNREIIIKQVAKMTTLPPERLENQTSTKVKELEFNVKNKLYGQDEAVDAVLERVYVSFAGIGTKNKPVASFLFLGPTGTGKTELAKLLSENLDMKLLRYDMSEFQEKHTLSSLIGAPPGYVGFEDGNVGGGKLISDLSKHPFSIILFDEIEKAHPDVSNVLLQMLDEAKVTGSNGKVVNINNCIVILTSNLGSADNENNNIGFGTELEKSGEEDRAMKDFFKPELRNRIDCVCKFKKLEKLAIKKIVVKFINELHDSVKDKNIKLVFAESVIDHLANKGYDKKMGARPIARKIDELIKIPLSKKILFESLSNTKIFIEIHNDEVVLKENFVALPNLNDGVLNGDGIIDIS